VNQLTVLQQKVLRSRNGRHGTHNTSRTASETPASASPKRNVGALFYYAFSLWTHEIPSRFYEIRASDSSVEVAIDISFLSGEHGDNNAFEGEQQELGHAYMPNKHPKHKRWVGEIHVNEAHVWTEESPGRYALHAIGHALGLPNSDDIGWGAMPIYNLNDTLSGEGILRIEWLYGKK
jgi:hypothetical protein